MRAMVFGATGFIGSHVVEQLANAGHDVTAVVRAGSKTAFLETLGVRLLEGDFSSPDTLARQIEGHQVVYNCTANPKLHQSMQSHRAVEVELCSTIAKGAAHAKVARFLQLSTNQVYGYDLPLEPVDEEYPCTPAFPFQQAALEREQVLAQIAEQTNLDVVILRPTNAIGPRDTASFFSRLFQAHRTGRFPLIGGGLARFSAVDARDIGRAMAWLGSLPSARNQTYLLSGFEASWVEVKEELDRIRAQRARTQHLPQALAMGLARISEALTPYSQEPLLSRMAVKAMTTTMRFSDAKLRKTGFRTHYHAHEAMENAVASFLVMSDHAVTR